MKRTVFLRGGSSLALAVALTTGVAHAQQAKPDTAPTEVEEVVVTGSFIRGTPEDAALPVEVIGAEELQKRGSPSTVELLKAPVVPHMGWNTVTPPEGSKLFAGIENERFYFVHSYAVQEWNFDVAQPKMVPPQVTWSEHGVPFVAGVENGPLCALQFHPEKSGEAGAKLLRNWLETL